jgi:MoaA/NifB/PqqE/SkfB family radical SAM enzyme
MNKQLVPSYLILDITTECNFKCKMCHQWMTTENSTAINTSIKLGAIEQMAMINPNARILLTGGETMTKSVEFFDICKLARRLNLTVIANTNGSYLNESNFDYFLENGPRYILFSLDSHIEEVHTYLRGNKSSYRHLLEIIPKLVDRRNELNAQMTIYTHSIIMEKNIDYWDEYIDFARNNLKVDGVYFQLLKETFRMTSEEDKFYKTYFFKDRDKAKSIVNALKIKYSDDPFVGANDLDFELMSQEIVNPLDLELGICISGTKNIYLDSYGQLQLCMNMHEIIDKTEIPNIRNMSLLEFWHSNASSSFREVMSQCKKNCGMLNCHRKNSYG